MSKEHEWFPYQANSGGIIYKAPCCFQVYDQAHTSDDTDDFYNPYSEKLQEWGAIKEFGPEIIIAVALEAERMGYPNKRNSLVMAFHHFTDLKRGGEEIERWFVIDGEEIKVDHKLMDIKGREIVQPSTEFERRYLLSPKGFDYEKSGTVCRVCPFKPDIFRGRERIVLKPERESSLSSRYDDFKFCTSWKNGHKAIHGDCKLPDQYGLYSGNS